MTRREITWADDVDGLPVASGTTEFIKLINFDGSNFAFIVSGAADNFLL